jgi:hypothetical protein
VTAAAPGDVIVVGPGTYNETLAITKNNLSIFGAQAGRDARVGRHDPSKESIVDASGNAYGSGDGAGFFVQGNYIIIDGFTIQGGTAGSNASGIYVDAPYSAHILDNIIQNNAVGVFLLAPLYPLIEYNLFKANNKGTAGSNDYVFAGLSGFGIGEDYSQGTGVSENEFVGNLAAAIALYHPTSVEITGNASENDGSFVFSYDSNYCFFTHNRGRNFGSQGLLPLYNPATGLTDYPEAALEITFSNQGLQISDNDLEKGEPLNYNGIAFTLEFGVGSYAACANCQISNNTIKRFPGNGIVAQPYSSSSTLYSSAISRNDITDNGNDGILIEPAPANYCNMVMDNEVEGNHVNDCEDDTIGTFTAGTSDIWFNNVGSLSSPKGLCTPATLHHHD